MQLSRLFFRIALLLLPVAFVGTAWLYLYPIFHGCAFPTPPSTHLQPIAPFRLLSLGDPQLEGDSSLPNPDALIFPSVEYLVPHLRNATSLEERQDVVVQAARGVVQDIRRWLEGKRKAIDLWGNDLYLAHIVRSLRWWTEPSHVSVLGDLLGSQWVTDGEFEKRAGRYWNVVMKGFENVSDAVFGADELETEEVPKEPVGGGEGEGEEKEEGENSKPERKKLWGGKTEVLGADQSWVKRVINIAGNHDVGYAGDIDESRVDRFERAFGSVNWEIWFTLPEDLRSNHTVHPSTQDPITPEPPPALRLVILNSMNLDTPAWSSELQSETYSFMNHIITTSRPVTDKTHATVLLTHIPLEKESGICVDSPFFDFFEGGGVKEQNMLSDHASKIVLQGIFGMSGNKDVEGGGFGRRGIVINGHDHAGCDVVHYIRQPGVDDGCRVEEVKSEEAYWPTIPPNESMPVPSVDIDSVDVTAVSINETEIDTETETNETEASSESPAEASAEPPEPDPGPKWKARHFPPLPYEINEKNECTTIEKTPHIREITLRSMMGEYSGYAGFLSAWFDPSLGEKGEWVFEFGTCGIGVQHWWWIVHILDLVLVACLVVGGMASALESTASVKEDLRKRRAKNNVVSSSNAGVKAGSDAKGIPRIVDAKKDIVSAVTQPRA